MRFGWGYILYYDEKRKNTWNKFWLFLRSSKRSSYVCFRAGIRSRLLNQNKFKGVAITCKHK